MSDQDQFFIRQGGITISRGEVPVIHESGRALGLIAATAVNFLRCGCPAVQILYTDYESLAEGEKHPSQDVLEFCRRLERWNEVFDEGYVSNDYVIQTLVRRRAWVEP